MLKSKLLAKSQTCSWYLISGSYCYFLFLGPVLWSEHCSTFWGSQGYPENKGGEEEEGKSLSKAGRTLLLIKLYL